MKLMENRKTAIQELIDWAISLQYEQQQCIDWIVIKEKLESLLEMEKQQIMNAVYDSMGTNFDPNMGRAELYYNETFKQD